MDFAYDRITEDALPKDHASSASGSGESNRAGVDGGSSGSGGNTTDSKPEKPVSLNDDLQDAYKAFSASPWGSWLGGQVSSVVKQGQSVYQEAQQEFTSLGADASTSFANLRARALSLTTQPPNVTPVPGPSSSEDKDKSKDNETTPTAGKGEFSFSFDKFKAQAAKRLKDIQRAEDAADAALVDFGGKAYDFLRTAIAVTPGEDVGSSSQNRFETKDESGKRVFHTSRFDAQLHVIHTSENSFTQDPASEEFSSWTKQFDVEKKTEDITGDVSKYPELRSTMEKLVPDQVSYTNFWKRYYFLRHSIETAEARRRDLLKAASAEEEIGWGEESDDESVPATKSATTTTNTTTKAEDKPARPGSTESATTIHPPPTTTSRSSQAKPSEPRKSNDEKSQADSDTSYDLVGAQSGKTSQAPNSPKDSRKADDSSEEEDSEEEEDSSDDEDWE